MKTNYALAAVVPTQEENIGDIIHLCLYENQPTQNDVDALVAELRTDMEFGMTEMEIDEDYQLIELSAEVLREIKEERGIPDDLDDIHE